MGDVVTIMKDTTPGVHWRFSYDKVGKCELGFFQFEYFIYTTNRECFYLFQDVDTWNMYMRAWHGEKKKEKELERERMRKVNEKREKKNPPLLLPDGDDDDDDIDDDDGDDSGDDDDDDAALLIIRRLNWNDYTLYILI